MDPHELFERMIEAWNGHDGDGFVATFAEDCEVSSPVLTGKGHDVCTPVLGAVRRGVP